MSNMDELLKRINELAAKKKTVGLTPEETEEQASLRKEYLVNFRAAFTAQLDNTYVVDEKGNKTPLNNLKKK